VLGVLRSSCKGAPASLGKCVGGIPGELLVRESCVAEVEPATLTSGPRRWSVGQV
jgi:hypothetical protein